MNPTLFRQECTNDFSKRKIVFGDSAKSSDIKKVECACKSIPKHVLQAWSQFDGFIIAGNKNSPSGEFSFLTAAEVAKSAHPDEGLLENPQFDLNDIILSADANGDRYVVWRPSESQFIVVDVTSAYNLPLGESFDGVLEYAFEHFVKEKDRFGHVYTSEGTAKRTFKMLSPCGSKQTLDMYGRQCGDVTWLVRNESVLLIGSGVGEPGYIGDAYLCAPPNYAASKLVSRREFIAGIAQLDTTVIFLSVAINGRVSLCGQDVSTIKHALIKEFSGKYIGSASQLECVTSGDYVYFVMEKSDGGFELWRTDGTPKQTKKVKAFKHRCVNLVDRDGKLFFVGG